MQNPVKLDRKAMMDDDVKSRKHKFLCLPTRMWRIVQDYCQQSSLHGLKYISSVDLPYIERYLWLGIFIYCVYCSVTLIMEAWESWREKPFLITFDSHMTPIWAIPFPAVTICTYFSVKKSVLDISKSDNLTQLFYASGVCPNGKSFRTKDIAYVGNDFYDFILKAAPSCSEMMKFCSFLGQPIDCCEIFDPILTEEGLCWIFNNLPLDIILNNNTYNPYPSKKHPEHARFWSPRSGYPLPDLRGHNDSYTYPRWEQIAGESFGLQVMLFQNMTEWQEECTGGYSGFKIVITNPADLPIAANLNLRVVVNRDTNIMLTPNTLQSGVDLESISPQIRSCVFQDERELYFFKQYTEKNCDLECNSLFYHKECGCAPFYYPRGKYTRICSTTTDLACLMRVRNKMTKSTMERQMVNKNLFVHPCGCYRGCQQLSFKSTDFFTDFLYTGKDPPWSMGKTLGDDQVTKVSIYFRSNQFLGKHRTIRYTDLKFAGTCGGLLSLFMGFSVISAIEVLYAFLLRPLSRLVHSACCSGPPTPAVPAPLPTRMIKVEPLPTFRVTGANQRRF